MFRKSKSKNDMQRTVSLYADDAAQEPTGQEAALPPPLPELPYMPDPSLAAAQRSAMPYSIHRTEVLYDGDAGRPGPGAVPAASPMARTMDAEAAYQVVHQVLPGHEQASPAPQSAEPVAPLTGPSDMSRHIEDADATVKLDRSVPPLPSLDQLKPAGVPDVVNRFAPWDVNQGVSRMQITWNGRAYTFTHPIEITIGRDAGNSLIIPDAHVSGSHAVLNFTPSGVMVRNVSSMRNGHQNPIFINDVPISQVTQLHNGDILKLNCVPLHITWATATVKKPVTPPAPESRQSVHETMPVDLDAASNIHATVQSTPLSVTWTIPGRQQQSAMVMLSGMRGIFIGRSETDDVFIDDPNFSVSRSHVGIEVEDGVAMLRNASVDRQGRTGYNPVYLDGQRLTEAIPLSEAYGKTLQLGLVKMTIDPA